MDDPPPPRPSSFGWGLTLAVLGAVALPLYGVVAVLRSDVCSPDSASYYCSGSGQSLGTWIGVVAGPGALVAGLVVAGLSRRDTVADLQWPWWVVTAQAVAFLTITLLSGQVS